MDVKDIEIKWSSVEDNGNEGYTSIRLSDECIPDLFIGSRNDYQKSLILKLPENFRINLKSINKQNLTLTYFKETQWIILALNDIAFLDLFNELILSVYNRIEKLSEPEEYTNELIATFHKWCDLFEESINNRLDEKTIMGLFGEMRVLIDFIKQSDPNSINDLLTGWRGPYDENHDFVFNSESFEVKTGQLKNSCYKISSEMQLEAEPGKRLQLIIVKIERDYVNGYTLTGYLNIIRNTILENQGDFSIILRAISQKGLSPSNIHDYDNYMYKSISSQYFNCTEPGFPRIISSEIPKEIRNIRYEICVGGLDNYIDKTIEY